MCATVNRLKKSYNETLRFGDIKDHVMRFSKFKTGINILSPVDLSQRKQK